MIELSGICIEADATAIEGGLKDAERAVRRFQNRYRHPQGFVMPESLMPKPLNLALTMIAAPADRLMLALIDRETGRYLPVQEISTHINDDVDAGQAIVTVSLVADVIPPFSPLVPPAPAS